MPKVMKYERDLKKKAKKAPGAIPSQGIPPDPLEPNEGSFASGEGVDLSNAPKLPEIDVPAEQPTLDTKTQVSDIIRQNPKYKIAPQKNETFDGFRARALPIVRAAMQELAHDPSQYIPIIMQSQAIKLIDAWIDAGMPDDFSVNHEAMQQEPGAVERLYPVPEDPGWRKEAIQSDQPLPPPPGILLINHGVGDKEGYAQTGKQQDAIAELAKHIKSGDFGRARAFAHKASVDMGLSDDDIGSIIDSSLPSAQEASDLPHHRLLALASAAHGSSKFPEYASLLQERFKNMEGLPPEAQNQLRSHLGTLGVQV